MALVSVIIPTYGIPVFLDKAINSVLNQTFSDLELIIVDDNNSDTEARICTETLIDQFSDKRIKYIQHDRNRNGAVARNTGIAHSSGQYIAFLDSDDEYFPNRLQKCVNVIHKLPPEVGGVYTGCEFRCKGRTYNKYKDVKSGNFLAETLACSFMFCSGSNIFVRREVVKQLNGFDESFLRHQDYEFLVRFFEHYNLEAIPEILVVKNNENFNVPPVEKMVTIKEQYLTKFQLIIDSLSDDEVDYIYHKNYVSIGEQALMQGKKQYLQNTIGWQLIMED